MSRILVLLSFALIDSQKLTALAKGLLLTLKSFASLLTSVVRPDLFN